MRGLVQIVVNGSVLPDRILRKGPLKIGEAIILTKGLGTGTILAADMRAKAKGAWVSAALRSMLQSNRRAAGIVQKFGCSACTDVTGFGFLGHLIEMIQHTGADQRHEHSAASAEIAELSAPVVSVELFLNSVPTLLGAKECIEMGVMSSLQPEVNLQKNG